MESASNWNSLFKKSPERNLMSSWTVNFENAQYLKNIQAAITALSKVDATKLAANYRDQYGRLLKVTKLLEARFSSLDPELCTQAQFNNWHSWISNLHNQAQAYAQNLSIGHLQNANNISDQILESLRPFHAIPAAEEAKSVVESAAALNKKVVSEIEARAKSVETQFNQLSNEIVQAKARLDENNQIIQQQKARLDQSIAEFQK